MKLTLIFAISFAAVALVAALAGGSRADAAGVRVDKIDFRGWHNALRLSNGIVEAVIVPQIGRIMLFQWVNQPESDALFVNKDLEGKVVAGMKPTDWANFGGDKLWPSPQSDWPQHTGIAWPPDRAFDGDPQKAEILPNGIRLTTRVSDAFAAHSVRTITLRPGEARLYISQEIVKD